MGKPKFSEDFKQDAVHPLPDSGLLANHEKEIVVRGYITSQKHEGWVQYMKDCTLQSLIGMCGTGFRYY